MAECTVNTNTLPRSRCCSVVTRSPAAHSASALLGTPTQSSRSQRYPRRTDQVVEQGYCKHACDCVTTTSQRVQSRLAPSPTLASNDVRTGAPTHERSFQLVVNIIRFCRDLAVTLYCCFGNFTCSLTCRCPCKCS